MCAKFYYSNASARDCVCVCTTRQLKNQGKAHEKSVEMSAYIIILITRMACGRERVKERNYE